MIDLKYKVLRYVGTLSRAINSTSDLKYKNYNLQKGQYLFLTRVCENPGINLAELSNMLKVDKATTTKAVNKLVDIGYLNKEADEGDKRGFNLTPTPKALEIYKKIIAEEEQQLEISFKGFSKEEKELATSFMERMSNNIEDYWAESKSKKKNSF